MLFSERVLKNGLGKLHVFCQNMERILPKQKDLAGMKHLLISKQNTYTAQNIFLKIFLKEIKYLFKCPFMNMCYRPDYTTLLLLKTNLILTKMFMMF